MQRADGTVVITHHGRVATALAAVLAGKARRVVGPRWRCRPARHHLGA